MSSSVGKSRTQGEGSGEQDSIGLVERYFDEQAQEWSDLYQDTHSVNDLVLIDRKNAAVAFLCNHLTPNARVLDAGCGAGLTALELVRKGFFVHGVDISQQMLDRCEHNLSANGIQKDKYIFTHTDLVQSSLPEGSFDGIVALGFLQYQSDEHSALKILNALLKSDGILVITGPASRPLSRCFGLPGLINSAKDRLRGTRAFIKARALWRRLRGWKEDQNMTGADKMLREISRHTYSFGRFRSLLNNADFEVLGKKGHGYVGFSNRLSMKSQIFLHRFFTRLSAVLPIGRWGSDLIFVARKKN